MALTTTIAKFQIKICILLIVTTILYEDISAIDISNTTDGLNQHSAENLLPNSKVINEYLVKLSNKLSKSHNFEELNDKLNSRTRLEIANVLRNLNSDAVVSALLPILKEEKEGSRRLLGKEQNLKDYVDCVEDINTFLNAAQETLVWALRMVDASGKPGPGLLQGNVRFLGDFDQCVTTETDQRFDTQYCLTTVAIKTLGPFKFSNPFGAQIGLCVPDSCSAGDLRVILDQYFVNTFGNGSAFVGANVCQEKDLPLTDKAKVAITILSVLGTLMVIGTLYDILSVKGLWRRMFSTEEEDYMTTSYQKMQENAHRSEYEPLVNKTTSSTSPGTFGRFMLSFSVYNNTTKLLSTSQASGNIDCINGIRTISMTWVVLGHSIIFGIAMMDNVKPYLEMSYGRWTFQVIANALVAVDTFFALSGMLLVYLILKELRKTGPSPGFFGQMYFHRFWRLTPPYMLVLMTYVTLFQYLSDGPAWPQHGIEPACDDSWWTNLLYINNVVKVDKMCMGWSWYLANDMQFFIISPLMFLPIFYLGTIGLVIPFILLVGNAMASGIITYENDLPPVLELFSGGTDDYFKLYYVKPYTRIGSYIIGMMTGYLLYKYDCKARLPKFAVALGWIVATAVALAVQYGVFEQTNGHPVTPEVSALYNSLHRISWAAAVCWVIFACANGYGGFVNTLLSWKALVPLSRLTYCVYLVHPVIINFHYYSQRRTIYLDNNNVVFSFLGILVMSYMVGYVASMTFEAPMIGIEKTFKNPKS